MSYKTLLHNFQSEIAIQNNNVLFLFLYFLCVVLCEREENGNS